MDNWRQGQGNQGRNYGNYKRKGQYVRDGNYNRDNNYNRNNYGNRNDRAGPYVPPQNWDSSLRETGGNMSRIEDMMQKMMRRDGKQNLLKKKADVEVYGSHRRSVVHSTDREWCPSIPGKVVTDVVTISQSGEENTLIGSPAGSASGSEAGSTSGSQPAHASDSDSGSSTGSGSHDKVASSDEATSSGEVPVPRIYDPDPVAGEPNRWCVEGKCQIYRDARMRNEKEKMAHLITEERRVLTGSLHTILDIHLIFQLHKCDWMARDPGAYSEEIAREFYASYAATLHGSIDKRSKPTAQDPLTTTMLDSLRDDIDSILIAPTYEPESAPTILADDTILDALFREDTDTEPEPTHARGKMHRSSQNSDTTEEARTKKRERQRTEQARKASIIDEELRQQNVCERACGASSSVPIVEVLTVESHDVSTTDGAVRMIYSTTEGAVIADVGTTNGGPNVVVAGFGN
uniref:Integrase core domain containing protein n=1 Tax=Solanum tuberosum TaxID=4113 RepID=M1DBZ8_SOLTU